MGATVEATERCAAVDEKRLDWKGPKKASQSDEVECEKTEMNSGN